MTDGAIKGLFVPFFYPGEGWGVMGPWIETPDGQEWRPVWMPPRLDRDPFGEAAKSLAEHYAREMSRACWEGTR